MKPIWHYFILLCVSTILVNCKQKPSNTLVVHILQEPENLHPTNGSTSALGLEINMYTHLSLMKINYKTNELLPCIVKSLPIISSDGLNFTYELKDSLTWDDNTAVTAADVLFTAKANKCLLTDNPSSKQSWDNIKDIIIDPSNPKKFTVVMNYQNAFNVWIWTEFNIIEESFFDKTKTLSKYSLSNVSDSLFIKTKKDIKLWANEFNSPKYYSDPKFMNGGGPYKVTKWDKGISITLEKKKNYWAKDYQKDWCWQANPDKIIFKLTANSAATMLELKNGLLDVTTSIDYASYSTLANDKDFTKNFVTKLADTYNYTYIAMNMKPDGKTHKPLFSDILVRRAMAMLIPYDQINKIIFDNQCKRMVGPTSPLKKEFNTTLKAIEYNIEKAQQLLNQAGWADTDNDQILDKVINGEKVKFQFSINFLNSQKQFENIVKQINESFRKVNIQADLNSLDYNGFISKSLSHDFDMSIGSWQTRPSPDDFSQIWNTSSWTNNGFNFTGFGSAKSDALIDSVNSCADEEKRIGLSKRFQQMVYDEQPYIFMFCSIRRVIVSKKWDNLEIYTDYPGVLLNTLSIHN